MYAFQNNDWIVETYGMQAKLPPGTIDIPAERQTENPDIPAGRLLLLPHMTEGSCMSSYHYSKNRIAGIMNADELAELRQVFNEACRQSRMAPSAAPAKFIASGLLTAFRAGVNDRELLLRLVSNQSNYPYEVAERPKETLTEIVLNSLTSARSIPLN
jgi:hypothetical protein